MTKREQQLVQRRLHAQELLEWKRRLDAEELEIRQIEKQALAAWDHQRVKSKGQSTADPSTIAEGESWGKFVTTLKIKILAAIPDVAAFCIL